ncbi:MAG: DNA polymerase III subunit delta [Candidatus Peribacteraceae bacterium]|nr:DNA polymerase III subunit delta [Candidatus Peribacteraceae bacterium]
MRYTAAVAANFFYFTGENAYALREELGKWKRQFMERHGEENLLVLPAATVRFRSFLDEAGVAPFIAAKRFILVEGTPPFSKEEVEALPSSIHPDCIVVIADARPDKRLNAVKALAKAAEMKEFPLLKGAPLLHWMDRYAEACGVTLTRPVSSALLDVVGEDQDALSREIEKLALYATGTPLTPAHVEALAVPSGERKVWQLTQYLAEGKRGGAMRYARQLLEHGEDPYAVWSVLLWMLQSLVSVRAAVRGGERQPARIASQFRVPFPTARALLPLASRIADDRLHDFLSWAAGSDVHLKTGGYRASRDAPEELICLIDSFIIRCGDAAAA